MTNLIFPEPFYNRLLSNNERIGLTQDGKFEVLPPESFCSRLERFFTFRQDPNIDTVHSRLKTLVEQAERAEGPDMASLTQEIRLHGKTGYRYLEANIMYLRKKLDGIGQLNSFSKLILSVINTALRFFCMSPIQLKTYAKSFEQDGIPCIDRSFSFHWSTGEEYVNPFEREGLRLRELDRDTCQFSSDPVHEEEIQKLEKGLTDYYSICQMSKIFNQPGVTTTQAFANLEIHFDPQQGTFFAGLNNPRARNIYNPFSDLFGRERIGPEKISPLFANYLNEIPEHQKTFRCSIEARDPQGIVSVHELNWTVQPTRGAPFYLNGGSQPFQLEPGTQYTFYGENDQEIDSLCIRHR